MNRWQIEKQSGALTAQAPQSQTQPTQRVVLTSLKDNLQQRLVEIDEALKALDANPGVEEVMNLLQKVNQKGLY